MSVTAHDLVQKQCKPCSSGSGKLSDAEIRKKLQLLDTDWSLDAAGPALYREFQFKGMSKTMYFVNALAYLADREGHHPDINFGWGYCNVRFTTHAINGLSENDFICAAKLDRLLAE